MDRNFFDQSLINPEKETHQLYKNWRENFVIPLLIGVLIFGALALLPAILASDNLIQKSVYISAYLFTFVVTIIRFPYTTRMIVFLLNIYILGVGELVTFGTNGDSLFFFLGLATFATMMFSVRAGIITVIITIITYSIFTGLYVSGALLPASPMGTPATLAGWISEILAMLMFAAVIILGFRSLEREFLKAQKQVDASLVALNEERNSLESKVQERTQQLHKVNVFGQNITSIFNIEKLLVEAAQFIETEFECYYTAFFFIDSVEKWAELKYASGETGRVLRENNQRFDLEGRSSIAKAASTKISQIATDISQMRLENPLLPYTRSQLALPMLSGENLIGILDIHSSKENAYSQQDIETYQNIANSIASAIENARLYQETQQSLTEMRATQRQYLQGVWDARTANQPIEYALGDEDTSAQNLIEIPMSLRDHVIGQVQMSASSGWTSEQKNLVEAIISQATLALENARLVEESQSSASQERLTNEIIAKIWSSTNMDNIMQTVVRELGRNLEANEVEIEITMSKLEDE